MEDGYRPMKRHRIRDVLASPPSEAPITVCGWVRTKRTAKRFAFLAINDGSSQETLQLIADAGTPAFAALDGVLTGAAVRARGATKASPGAGQRIEMQVDELEVLGPAPAEYPLQKKGHTLEFLREIGHLRPRTNTFGAVFRVRNVLAATVHEFFQLRGFVWAHTRSSRGRTARAPARCSGSRRPPPAGRSSSAAPPTSR